jgi:crotonobetaine/carnitine-CoA ligase
MPNPDLTPAQVLALYPPHADTIPSLISSRRSYAADRPAAQFEERVWNYQSIDDGSEVLAKLLAWQGVAKGDHVVLVAGNSDLSVLLFLATARLGAVFIPLNPAATDDELRYLLDKSRAKVVVSQSAEGQRIAALYRRAGDSIPRLMDLTDIGAAAECSDDVILHIEGLIASSYKAPIADIGPDDPAVVVFTSGTTGYPKGVVHSHRNYVWAAEGFVDRLCLQPSDRLLTILPFFHINALFYSLGGALAAGGTMITTAKFSASRFWDMAAQAGATEVNILAAVGSILGNRPRSEFNPQHRISKIYGAPINAELLRLFNDEFQVPDLIEGFGMSEIPGACCNPFIGPRKLGSFGKPAIHPRLPQQRTEMRVEDEYGSLLPAGEVGELTVRSPIMFLEYLDDPEQTKAAFRDGWFLTGDLVRQDEDGYFFFVARKKDIIRRRGENISGAELDRVFSQHPDIAEAAAIGVPSDLGEEEVMIVLVARPSARPDPAEILAWCRKRLAPMKVPRYILFKDALPHTPSHRVAKHLLKNDTSLRSAAFDADRQT